MICVETGCVSLNKAGEELCGDRVETVRSGGTVTMVLADGLGSGVKANILSSLTSKILGTMIASGMKTADAVQTVAQTLPVCSVRHIGYSTFSVLHLNPDGAASLIQYENPPAILLRRGKRVPYPTRKSQIFGKEILETDLTLGEGDMVLLISDGVVHAGAGLAYNNRWQFEDVCAFVERSYTPQTTAKGMAAALAGACRQLYIGEPGDDATVAVARLRARQAVDVMVGPPADPDDAGRMVLDFLAGEGKKAVCGGTTSQIVADALGEPLKVDAETGEAEAPGVGPPGDSLPGRGIPPVATLKGIDLVTEGVLTISRMLEILDRYSLPGEPEDDLSEQDGASRLAHLLIEEATDVRFFVGTAVNPAHRRPDFPANLAVKAKLVGQLAEGLKALGKSAELRFY